MNFALISRTILFVGDCYLEKSNCFVNSQANDFVKIGQRSTKQQSSTNGRNKFGFQRYSDRQGTLRRALYTLSDFGIKKLFL